jgi:hypothetical protein
LIFGGNHPRIEVAGAFWKPQNLSKNAQTRAEWLRVCLQTGELIYSAVESLIILATWWVFGANSDSLSIQLVAMDVLAVNLLGQVKL